MEKSFQRQKTQFGIAFPKVHFEPSEMVISDNTIFAYEKGIP